VGRQGARQVPHNKRFREKGKSNFHAIIIALFHFHGLLIFFYIILCRHEKNLWTPNNYGHQAVASFGKILFRLLNMLEGPSKCFGSLGGFRAY
jgi:sulfatase maturation enzyme AslB (radical SAM superfamily)